MALIFGISRRLPQIVIPTELAERLNVGEAYVSQILSDKKKAGKRALGELVNFNQSNSVLKKDPEP
jgi:hypothetical protein